MPLGAALVAGAAVGAGCYAATHRPARVHHRYGRQVIIVTSGPSHRTVRLVVPPGMGAGMVMEIAIDGMPYFVTVPAGLAPGMEFDAQVQVVAPQPQAFVAAPPQPPPFVPRAAIVSDNHGTWSAEKFATLHQAERAWSGLSMWFASVLFIERMDGTFNAFKEYGTGSSVQKIKSRFQEEYQHSLFASVHEQQAAFAQAQAPVTATPAATPPVVSATAPPAFGAPPAPPAYGAPPPAAPPAYGAPPPAQAAAAPPPPYEQPPTNPFA